MFHQNKNNMNSFDDEYHKLAQNVIQHGVWVNNDRTGKRCLTITGQRCEYDLSDGKFPAITTKKFFTSAMIGELLGFIRGFDNAKNFRNLQCNFWDANANKSVDWVNNPNRLGKDDLGRIYGVQSRRWINRHSDVTDQLAMVVDKLIGGIDDRRLIVSHWNPGESNEMALVPCHDFYQFHLINGKLSISMYQRSNDVPLGTPMNIASYSLLLLLIAQITRTVPEKFVHFMGDVHIYEDQLDLMAEQLTRRPYTPPHMVINSEITTLHDLETWVTTDDFCLADYTYHPEVKYPFAI